jgi:hypothetical protein
MLKQVQHDGRGGDGRALASARFAFYQAPLNAQISPFGVGFLNQVDLPLPMPSLQLLFSRNRVCHLTKRLSVDKTECAMVGRKARRGACVVLEEPCGEIGCNANVDRSLFLAGKDVNIRLLHRYGDNIQYRHAELVSASMPQSLGETGCSQFIRTIEAWTLKQVQDDRKLGDPCA